MSAFVALDIAIAVIGLVVLSLFAWRLWKQVRALGSVVGAAANRIGAAQAALDDIARAAERTGDRLDVHSL